MRAYRVELSFNNREAWIVLPVNPESIEISESSEGKTYDVMGLGQINVIKDRSLTEYSFSSIFPARMEGYHSNTQPAVEADQSEKFYHPVYYIKLLEKWMATKRPIRFIFISDTYEINTAVSIESFQWKEAGGGGGDITYSIKLKKYVFYAAKRIATESTSGNIKEQTIKKVTTKKEAVKDRPNEKIQPRTYKLVAGDTLWQVAKKQLGNGNRWTEIQNLNNIKDSEITRLAVGRVLKLP